MDIISLIITSILMLIPIFISYKENLELEKEIVVSVVRAIIQLIIIGYILDTIFGMRSNIFIIILILIMIFNASINTKNRSGEIKNVIAISFISMSVGTLVTMAVLILSGAIKFTANEVIPVAGMVVSNAMVAINISYRHLNTSFKNRRSEVEVKLSLGADIKESSKDIIRENIKIAIISTIDSAKTLGVVSLPGMMTGLILGGASPMEAIRFQIMVTFMVLSSSSIAVLMVIYLCYKYFFNDRKQLII